jgi:DNA-binding MarR family transcriptional regulator/GNAT superfamily N-acetyltransferase
MDKAQIGQVRRFNRVLTQRIGALAESYLTRGRPLGQARVIFEVGSSGNGSDVRTLRIRLGLDAGYMSRLLRALEAQQLVEVRKKPNDARSRQVHLTPRGQVEFEAYERLSDDLAMSILAPLTTTECDRLVKAMGEVEWLLRSVAVDIVVEPTGSRDAAWCLDQYFAELDRRFDGGFDPGLGGGKPAEEEGHFVIARLEGDAVGCGVLRPLGNGVGEIKRVWVSERARGHGVAGKIMERLEALAHGDGFHTLRLDTNKALTEAHALYRKLGYAEISRYNANPYAHHWFEKAL